MVDDQNELCIPPIETKESLQHIPVGYTSRMADKQRHRAVANSWHVGVAGLLMWILLLQTQATHWDPVHLVAGIEVEIMLDTGRHRPEPRQKTERRPQHHRHEGPDGPSNRTSQGVQLMADRSWEDTTPCAHSLNSRVAHYKQCNRAPAKPGQANLVQKVNMKLTRALSDRVRPIGAIGPGTGWRHSPEGRDSQRLNGARLADAKTGDTQQTRAQLWHDPHSETPLPAIEPDGQDPNRHGPIQRPRQRSRTRVATAGATPRHHQAHLLGPPDYPADSRTVPITQTRPQKDTPRRNEERLRTVSEHIKHAHRHAPDKSSELRPAGDHRGGSSSIIPNDQACSIVKRRADPSQNECSQHISGTSTILIISHGTQKRAVMVTHLFSEVQPS